MKLVLSKVMLGVMTAGTLANAYAQSNSMSAPTNTVTVRSAGTGYTPSGPAPEFSQLDTNSNGSIDQSEVTGYKLLANDFRMADSNRDGRISKREYAHWKSMP